MFIQLTGEWTRKIHRLFFKRHFLKASLFFTVFYVNDSVVLTKKPLFLHDFYSCVTVISVFPSHKKANKVLQRWRVSAILCFSSFRETKRGDVVSIRLA